MENEIIASTRAITNHHIKCFFDFDFEGILFDYAQGAMVSTPFGPLKDVEAIRRMFQAMFVEFQKPGMTFTMKLLSVEGQYTYTLWTAETADNVYEVGTDTLVVRDGKIVAQSFAAKITPKG